MEKEKNKGLPVELSNLEDGDYPIASNPVFAEMQVSGRPFVLSFLPISENIFEGMSAILVSAILVHLDNSHGYANDAPFYCRISGDNLIGAFSFADIKQYKKLIVREGKVIDIV